MRSAWMMPVVAALACARPPAPGDVGGMSESNATETSGSSESEDSYNFIPPEEESGDSETGTGPVDSHAEDIVPIWIYNCVIYCHGSGVEGPAADLNLEWDQAYDALVGVPATQVDMTLVAPGSPADSYLWHKLNATHLDVGGSGDTMPLNQPLLDAEALERIETWITIGAPP